MKTSLPELFEAAARGDSAAEAQLVEENARLVSSLAGRFLYTGQEFDDLYQVGMVGLLRAIRKFDLSRGVCFSTYAVPVILGEIRRFLRDDSSLKVSRNVREQYIALQRCEQTLSKRFGRSPTLSELCEETGLSREEALQALEAGTRPVSLSSPIGEDETLTLADSLPENETIDSIDLLALKDGISQLDAEDRQIITLRYFYAKTQQQTADLLQMSQVRVSRREKKIIDCLRARLEDTG